MRPQPILHAALLICFLAATAHAGYEQPAFIDGGQSIDGRFAVTASQVVDSQAGVKGKPPKPHPAHGPFRWRFTWTDTQTGESNTFDAAGVQCGQIYAHLFVAPDGETFALWNHITLWHPAKSQGHGANLVVDPATPGRIPAEKQAHEALSRRVVVYQRDGSIVKELAIGDFLTADEWPQVLAPFNRAHWIVDYKPLWFKATPRPGYALYRISPDYTVLQFCVVAAKGKPSRTVHVDLTKGEILPADWESSDANKIPVRPFIGPDKFPDNGAAHREGYVPSLDPVRTEGKYAQIAAPAAVAPIAYGPLTLVQKGFKKLDTPTWSLADELLLACDIEQAKLFKLVDGKLVELRQARRGRIGPDGRYYGMLDGKLCAWKLGETPQTILDAPPDGQELSLNDLTIGASGRLYFTTLKDPEVGRVTAVDVAKRTASVVYDAVELADLANPNGIALAPDGKQLYLGVSNYKNRKKSGIYRFAVADEGTIDVNAGKASAWAEVQGPDGLAFGPDGNMYATAGGVVVVIDADDKVIGKIKIPQGSGTNLCFGGDDGRTLFVTTNEALYAATPVQ